MTERAEAEFLDPSLFAVAACPSCGAHLRVLTGRADDFPPGTGRFAPGLAEHWRVFPNCGCAAHDVMVAAVQLAHDQGGLSQP